LEGAFDVLLLLALSFLILLGPLEKKNECWGQMGFEECLN